MTLTPPADTAVELGTPIRFPLFDSLRAIAALSVFGFHVAFHLELLTGDRWSSYLGQLNIGVAIFFVISGFLLYRPFAKARVGRRGRARPQALRDPADPAHRARPTGSPCRSSR